jgi:hypothetical protein
VFKITLTIEIQRRTGLDALDWRRAHGLPDSTQVHNGFLEKTIDVSEGFARLHFPRSETNMRRRIDANILAAGELAADTQGNGIDLGNLSDERIRELFVAACHDLKLWEVRKEAKAEALAEIEETDEE